MSEAHRFSFNIGETLQATFCTEGSTILVSVTDNSTAKFDLYRCLRYSGNANLCVRLR